MFQRKIQFTEKSSLEVVSRIYNNEEKIMVTIIGPKNKNEVTASSVILSDEHLSALMDYLKEALEREKSWPIKEE